MNALEELSYLLRQALEAYAASQKMTEIPSIQASFEKPKNEAHGDFASNYAMLLASSLKQKPRDIAQGIVNHFKDPENFVESLEIAGPGFLNFRLSHFYFAKQLQKFLSQNLSAHLIPIGKGRRVLLEYVSANPTGPMHIGHGRNAAVGSALAKLLEASSYEVEQEFYINDHGVQILTLGKSVRYYLDRFLGKASETPPEGSYQGFYLEEWVTQHLEELKHLSDTSEINLGKKMGVYLLEQIKKDLALIRVSFNRYYPESSLYEKELPKQAIDLLKKRGFIYEQEGAVWFRSTEFGDDKDRVLVKQDGSYTYFTPDIAYHRDKFERNYDLYINVWGADHGGYIPRMKAAIKALGFDADQLKVPLIQMVQLKRGDEVVQMSKRAGTYVTLKEVAQEVGSDATRFFFLMRSSDTSLDFDLELAKKQSAENPVFYIQYAHARICQIFEKAKEEFKDLDLSKEISVLQKAQFLKEEKELIQKVFDFSNVVLVATEELAPHRVCFYLLELAKLFQSYYSRAKTDDRYRVIHPQKEITLAKLWVLSAVKEVLAFGLNLLLVSAPTQMKKGD